MTLADTASATTGRGCAGFQSGITAHYGTTNRLTFPAFDPYSRQPAYKACAVNVRRVLTADRAP